MADLPPVPADTYAEKVATSLVSSKQELLGAASSPALVTILQKEEHIEESNEIEDLIHEQDQSTCCLFCTKDLDNLENNLEHMSSEHGLYIPEIEYLSSLETIVGYLRTVVTEYNECLYCGMVKQSAEGIRRHMLDKDHCMINLEREPELLEFWDFSDSDAHDSDAEEESKSQSRARMTGTTAAAKDLSQGQYILPSGKVIGSKSKAREARLIARRTALAAAKDSSTSNQTITAGDVTNNDNTTDTRIAMSKPAEPGSQGRGNAGGGVGANQDRAVAVRDAVGLIGVSDKQTRSLITVQRKMQRQQAIVQASAAWADDLGGRNQKHYKVKMNLRAG